MILYTKPYPVIRRQGGAYVEGIWVRAAEPAPVTVNLNIQPNVNASEDDTMLCYANVGALTPRDPGGRIEGDIVLVDGQRYLVTSVNRWDAFGGAETAHDQYVLRQEIPKASGEA